MRMLAARREADLPPRRLPYRMLLAGLIFAAAAAAPAAAAQTAAAAPPLSGAVGIWYDTRREGAVEIVPCGERLCGHIVWLEKPNDNTGRPLTDRLNPLRASRQRLICGLQVIGNLELQRSGAWDAGWIYDPKEGRSYDLELQLRSADRLEVTGYIGSKLLSESFMWTRAPPDLDRCQVR